MRLSSFIEFVQKNDKTIVFSTITKSIIEFNNEEFKDLKSGNFEKFDKKTIQFLIEKQIITCLQDEFSYVKFLINRDRYSPISLNTYIMFTENCNFSCVYCYQKGQVCGKNISEEVIDDVINWYEKILLRRLFLILFFLTLFVKYDNIVMLCKMS